MIYIISIHILHIYIYICISNSQINDKFFAENTSQENTLQYLVIYKLLLYYWDNNCYFHNLQANTY